MANDNKNVDRSTPGQPGQTLMQSPVPSTDVEKKVLTKQAPKARKYFSLSGGLQIAEPLRRNDDGSYKIAEQRIAEFTPISQAPNGEVTKVKYGMLHTDDPAIIELLENHRETLGVHTDVLTEAEYNARAKADVIANDPAVGAAMIERLDAAESENALLKDALAKLQQK